MMAHSLGAKRLQRWRRQTAFFFTRSKALAQQASLNITVWNVEAGLPATETTSSRLPAPTAPA